MTQLVTFAQPVAPYGAGDTRLVPDDVAADLLEQGLISDYEPFPRRSADEATREPAAKPAPVVQPRQQPKPARPIRPQLKPTRPAAASAARKVS